MDYTVLPVICFKPSQRGWYAVYLTWRDGRLSWLPIQVVITIVTLPRVGVERMTCWSHKITLTLVQHLNHYSIKQNLTFLLVTDWRLCCCHVKDELIWATVHQLHQREASAAVQSHHVHHRAGGVQARGHWLEVHRLRSGSPADHRPHWEGNGSWWFLSPTQIWNQNRAQLP